MYQKKGLYIDPSLVFEFAKSYIKWYNKISSLKYQWKSNV